MLITCSPKKDVTPAIDTNKLPSTIWEKSLGSYENESAESALVTSDGGCIIVGNSDTQSKGLEKSEDSKGEVDFWIIKINANGQKIWDKTFGGDRRDLAKAIVSTTDGGFIIVGASESNISGDKTEKNRGEIDFWIVKINANGQKIWDKTFGGNKSDFATSIVASQDGGFIIGGYSGSNTSADKTESSKGGTDYWIVKINSNGQKLWDKTIGGNGEDFFNTIISTTDGAFMVAGSSQNSKGGDKTGAIKGDSDFWIVKINTDGKKIWDKTFGGNDAQILGSISATSDGGYLLVGSSSSDISFDKSSSKKGEEDAWIIKIDSQGQKVWDKSLGGSGFDGFSSILIPKDGGFILAGYSTSDISGDKSEKNYGLTDIWITKINNSGEKIWDKTLGGSLYDLTTSILPTSDGNFLIISSSNSEVSGTKTDPAKARLYFDFWIMKMGYK